MFKTGDPFAGVCLCIKRRGVDTGILLRNKLLMVGVEMWVKVYSPNVQAIEVVKRAEKRARRGKLYYMRYVVAFDSYDPPPFYSPFFGLAGMCVDGWLIRMGDIGYRNMIRVVWRGRLRSI